MLANDARLALDQLIRELEAAAHGSTKLDGRIDHVLSANLAIRPNLAELLVGEGVSWPTVREALADRVPAYTTSLDAAIEGENIVFVVRSVARGKWGAVQRVFGGREVLAWAATEPLARRLAALLAHSMILAQKAPPPQARPAAPAAEPAQAGETEWKVRF
jgi:hypothetical protein